MENRNGLIVQADLTHADRRAERKAARDMIRVSRRAPTRDTTALTSYPIRGRPA